MLRKFSEEEIIKGIVSDYPKIKEEFKKTLYDNGFRWQKDSYTGNGFGMEGVWINYGDRLSIRARWGMVNANAIIYVEKEFFGKIKKFFDLYFPNDGMDSEDYDYDLLNKGELFKKDELQAKDKKDELPVKDKKDEVRGKKEKVKMMTTKHYLEIVATKRTDDYHACIRDHPELWGCGKSYDEAIGDLVRSHKQEFEIGIEYDVCKKKYGFYIITCVNCGFKKFVGELASFDMIERLNETSKCCKKPNYD